MTNDLTTEHIEELKELFITFDKNGDQSISRDELKEAFRLFGQNMTDKQILDLINSVDKDGNGSIEFPEFIVLMGKYVTKVDTEAELKAAFNFFDLNGDGYISASDLSQIMKRVGEKMTDNEICDIIIEGDKDGDNQLSYSDFLGIMKS